MVYIKLNDKLKQLLNITTEYIHYNDLKELNISKDIDEHLSSYITMDTIEFDYNYDIKKMDDDRPQEVKKKINNYLCNYNNKYYLKNKKQNNDNFIMKDFSESLGFGVSFIFILFSSGLFGYFFGSKVLNVAQEYCLILALLSMVLSILLEFSIFQIKELKKKKVKCN